MFTPYNNLHTSHPNHVKYLLSHAKGVDSMQRVDRAVSDFQYQVQSGMEQVGPFGIDDWDLVHVRTLVRECKFDAEMRGRRLVVKIANDNLARLECQDAYDRIEGAHVECTELTGWLWLLVEDLESR